MPSEKALGLVIRTADWSETSRIATLWTRELGKVRVLAKGGRRLKSSFESGLDLLTLCRIVLLRKSPGSLDLLTEAQVAKRFSQLRQDLPALYAGYYIAELLGDLTQDYDPHPNLFDEALAALETLGTKGVLAGPRLARFEVILLRELGYMPSLETCAHCNGPVGQAVPDDASRQAQPDLQFSAAGGGVLCSVCQAGQRERRSLSPEAWRTLRRLAEPGEAWRDITELRLRTELRQLLNHYVTYVLGRRPRVLPYLGS
jgi:DNA repair protein RecO (recombination protein O)